MEKEVSLMDSEGTPYRAIYDNYADIDDNTALAVELDGDVGHTTVQAQGQDNSRDEAGLRKNSTGKKVIISRIRKEWVVGNKALPDEIIIDHLRASCEEFGVKI